MRSERMIHAMMNPPLPLACLAAAGLLIFPPLVAAVRAGSAVASDEHGEFGYAFGDDPPADLERAAVRRCREKSAHPDDVHVIVTSRRRGAGVIVRYAVDGQRHVYAYVGAESERQADELRHELRRRLRRQKDRDRGTLAGRKLTPGRRDDFRCQPPGGLTQSAALCPSNGGRRARCSWPRRSVCLRFSPGACTTPRVRPARRPARPPRPRPRTTPSSTTARTPPPPTARAGRTRVSSAPPTIHFRTEHPPAGSLNLRPLDNGQPAPWQPVHPQNPPQRLPSGPRSPFEVSGSGATVYNAPPPDDGVTGSDHRRLRPCGARQAGRRWPAP